MRTAQPYKHTLFNTQWLVNERTNHHFHCLLFCCFLFLFRDRYSILVCEVENIL